MALRAADAILALLPGKTEREVKEEGVAGAKEALRVHVELNAKLEAEERGKGASDE